MQAPHAHTHIWRSSYVVNCLKNAGHHSSVFYIYSVNEIHQALVLRPSCFPEKVGVNQKGVNIK
jgi:hypothetical protein